MLLAGILSKLTLRLPENVGYLHRTVQIHLNIT